MGKIFIKSGYELMLIDSNSILYIESQKHYLNIVMDTKDVYKVRSKIQDFVSDYSELGFIRIHQSIVVNPNKIVSLCGSWINLGTVELPISRSYSKEKKNIKKAIWRQCA